MKENDTLVKMESIENAANEETKYITDDEYLEDYWNNRMPEDVMKKDVMEYIDSLQISRQKEGLIAIHTLLENGMSWEWIHEAINDEYAKWQEYGFKLLFNNNFRQRIDTNLKTNFYSYLPEERAIAMLKEDLFHDIGYQRSAF